MTKQWLTGRRMQDRRRPFVRVRVEAAGECEHRALVGGGDHVGRCLECGTCIRTPFTIQGRADAPRLSANRLTMEEVRLPAVVVPVLQPCAA